MAYAQTDQFYGVYNNSRTAGLSPKAKPTSSPFVKEGLAFHELVQNQLRSDHGAPFPPSSLTQGGHQVDPSQKTSPPPSPASFANPALTTEASSNIKDDSWSFLDLIDIINPLQHIPIVGQIYRAVTGDDMKAATTIAGGMLFGGAIGGALAMADVALEAATGKDTGETVLAALAPPHMTTAQTSTPLSTQLSLAADGSAPTKPKPITADNLLTKDTSIAHNETMTKDEVATAMAASFAHSFPFDHADLAMEDPLSPDRISHNKRFFPAFDEDAPLPPSQRLYGHQTYQNITIKG
jgi:hypothetical protein